MPLDPHIKALDLDRLNARFGNDPAGAISLAASGALGPVALVSSFGAESAVLLHLTAQVDPSLPVIFIDTLMLFPETLTYQQDLATTLGLKDVRRIEPDRVALFEQDPDALLHRSDPDRCCTLRKTRTLDHALRGFGSWISGRKRFQNGQRANLPVFERDPTSHRIKINPLVNHSHSALRAHIEQHDLPRHPLIAQGYPSIGCAPCTTPVVTGEDPRAGRWRGLAKTECGIHVENGQVSRRKVAS